MRLLIFFLTLFLQLRAHAGEPAPSPLKPVVVNREAAALQTGKIFKDCPSCPELVIVPARDFDMGGTGADEQPVHRVRLTSFALGRNEVTQGQWQAIMGSNPSHFSGCGDACPVERVSWDDVQNFLDKLNAMTGKRYRLPSEAEWEYACRAGGRHEFCGGDDLSRVAWHQKNSDTTTHPSGQKQANAFGLFDMSGNVWEWVEDCWNDSYVGAPNDGTAWTKGDCKQRVRRGGSWIDDSLDVRASVRNGFLAKDRSIDFGFRVAISIAKTK